MNHHEFKDFRKKVWEDEEYICVYKDRSMKKLKVKILFVMKAKTNLLNLYQKQTFSKIIFIYKMIYSVKNKDDLRELKERAALQSKVKTSLIGRKVR